MPPQPAGQVIFTLFFDERRGATSIATQARQASDPDAAEYGHYLTKAALARRVSPRAGAVARCRRWFEGKGMTFVTTAHPQICRVHARRSDVRRVFGPESDQWLAAGRVTPSRHQWPLPPAIAMHLKYVDAGNFDSHHMAMAVKGLRAVRGGQAVTFPRPQPRAVPGMTPAEIRAIYDFPDEWTGKGETICVLNLGSRIREDDLRAFWKQHGIDRQPPRQIDLGVIAKGGFVQTLEPTMSAEWIGAMAPDADLVICNIDDQAAADPWAAFLAAAIAPDPGDGHPTPTVAVSTWSLPERVYFARHGRTVFADLLEQAAAVGVTVIAASGDWGVYDGRPSVEIDGVQVAEAPWPHGVFPSVEDYVLSVGGTMITSTTPLTELAWSGPLPPNHELRQFVPFSRLASSGGFSEDVAVPWWQQETLCPDGTPRHFRRGLNLPAVIPSGRGYPDVALMAQGAAIANPAGAGLASVGYEAIVGGEPINYAGGTSLAAPIWAAIVACMNQARRAAGQPRVGFVNPLLYELARSAAGSAASPFRSITVGAGDVEMHVLDEAGRPTSYRLEGFSAESGWNPVTGLGVPHVRRLIDMSVRGTGRRRRTRR
jgi:kumamolisin